MFQSESKFDDFEYSNYEGGVDVAGRPLRPHYYNEDDDVLSGNFHSDLKEQFQNANTAKKVGGGILKNPNSRPNTSGQNRELGGREEYERKYDDYYQDANNMIFHTGTFNADDEDAEMRSKNES